MSQTAAQSRANYAKNYAEPSHHSTSGSCRKAKDGRTQSEWLREGHYRGDLAVALCLPFCDPERVKVEPVKPKPLHQVFPRIPSYPRGSVAFMLAWGGK